MSCFRRWVALLFFLRSVMPNSGFRTWLLWKPILEPQDVACRLAPVGARMMGADSVDQAQRLEPREMGVQRGD